MDSIFYIFSVIILFLISMLLFSQNMIIEGFILQVIALLRIAYPFIKEI